MDRSWVKKRKENYRVVVDGGRYLDVKRLDDFADDLNELFKEHSGFKDIFADVEFDEVNECILCGYAPYEDSYDEDKKEFICANCGGGEKEMIFRRLDGKR